MAVAIGIVLAWRCKGILRMPKLTLSLVCVCGHDVRGRWARMAQGGGPPNHPAITVGDRLLPRSPSHPHMGTAADQREQFPPHHIIGNIYYVGLKTLASYLIVTFAARDHSLSGHNL